MKSEDSSLVVSKEVFFEGNSFLTRFFFCNDKLGLFLCFFSDVEARLVLTSGLGLNFGGSTVTSIFLLGEISRCNCFRGRWRDNPKDFFFLISLAPSNCGINSSSGCGLSVGSKDKSTIVLYILINNRKIKKNHLSESIFSSSSQNACDII